MTSGGLGDACALSCYVEGGSAGYLEWRRLRPCQDAGRARGPFRLKSQSSSRGRRYRIDSWPWSARGRPAQRNKILDEG